MACFFSPVFLLLIEPSLSSHILPDAQEIPQSTSDLTKGKHYEIETHWIFERYDLELWG